MLLGLGAAVCGACVGVLMWVNYVTLKEENVKLHGFYGGVQHDVTRDDAPECTEHSKTKAKVCA